MKEQDLKYWYGFYYKNFSIRPGTVLLESFHGKTVSDSPLVCAREIQRMYPGKYRMYYASNNVGAHGRFLCEAGIDAEPVDIYSLKYMKILATAEYIISNASLPIYYVRRPGQSYLQTWHGTPLKTLGKSMREGIESMYNVQHNFLQATHLLFPNEFTRSAIMRDYNLDDLYTGKVVMCGYPRNCIFFDSESAASVRRDHGLDGKKIYAYMPTWRGRSNRSIETEEYFEELRPILKQLDGSLRSDQILFVNFHPAVASAFSFDEYKHIRPFPKDTGNYEFLNCADALITDYSSVFFDFSLTGRPVILFMYDYEKYMNDRGMYMDVRELPFRKIYDADEFCACISSDEILCGSEPEAVSGIPGSLKSAGRGRTDFESCSAAEAQDSENSDNPGKTDFESCYAAVSQGSASGNQASLKSACLGRTDFESCSATEVQVSPKSADPGRTDFESHSASISLGSGSTARPGRDYYEKYAAYDSPDCTEKLLRLFLGGEDSGLPVTDYSGNKKKKIRVIAPRKLKTRQDLEDLSKAARSGADVAEISRSEAYGAETAGTEISRSGSAVSEAIGTDDADTVVLMYRKWFKDGFGQMLYDDFNDSFNYVITTNNLPATRFTLAMAKFGSRRAKKYLADADRRRCFSELDIKMPYIRDYVCTDGGVRYGAGNTGRLRSLEFSRRGFRIKVFVRGWKSEEITGGVLKLLSDQGKTIRTDIEKQDVKGGCLVTLKMDHSDKSEFIPLRWSVFIEASYCGEQVLLPVKTGSRKIRYYLKTCSVQSDMDGGFILFPYLAAGGSLRLCYREKNKYDTSAVRRREVLAVLLYLIIGRFLKKKKIKIIYEKFSRTAQDNSYFFFRYCMEMLPERERKKYFYVIDKDSPDYERVKGYGGQVLGFMSVKHMLYSMAANICISTDTIQHLYPWHARPGIVFGRIEKKDVFFLQHGVTALKKVDHLFGKHGIRPMKYFAVTSEMEQDIIVKYFGYERKDAPITGFTRWDALTDKSPDTGRIILIMPTWRGWLENALDDEFEASEYFRRYSELLTSRQFGSFLEENDLRCVFYLHPKFSDHIGEFKSVISERIELTPFGREPLNEIMMKSSMLITDYSSVCWDMLYMDKPVIFYQFDLDRVVEEQGSYIDMRTELPGPRAEESEELVALAKEFAGRGFRLRDKDAANTDRYFTYRDQKNCERTHAFLKEKGRA